MSQFTLSEEARDWQIPPQDMVKIWDDRKIILIYATASNSRNKRIFAEHLMDHRLVLQLPPTRAFNSTMTFVFESDEQKTYLVDITQAMQKDKIAILVWFYSGLERLKKGKVWDKHAAKMRRLDRQHVVVFMGTLPAWEFMSADRWSCWKASPNYTLIPFATDAVM